jgi:hypothetical protein
LHGTCPSCSIEPLKLAFAIAGAIALARFHYNHTNKGALMTEESVAICRWRIASNIGQAASITR